MNEIKIVFYIPRVKLIMEHFASDIQTYCAFFDKSTNFATKVEQYIMNKFGWKAIAKFPLTAMMFSKMAAMWLQKKIYPQVNDMYWANMQEKWLFWSYNVVQTL